MKKIVVPARSAGQRTDIFINTQLKEYSRSALETLFAKKHVELNGRPVRPGYKLKVGDSLKIDTSLLSAKPKQPKLPIIYEDDNVIVVNKPAGILTHSKGALNAEATVASFIKSKIADKSLTGNRAGIVHRLDRGTSGVIITAKNQKSLKWLQKQFSDRKTVKKYLAIVEGQPKKPFAIIDAPIGRNPKRPQTFKALSNGKPAQTKYNVLEDFKKDGGIYSLVELNPITGRTHQVRVHMAYIGNPVVGDFVYGHEGPGLLLHAKSLEVVLPNGQKHFFNAPLPRRFKEFQHDKSNI